MFRLILLMVGLLLLSPLGCYHSLEINDDGNDSDFESDTEPGSGTGSGGSYCVDDFYDATTGMCWEDPPILEGHSQSGAIGHCNDLGGDWHLPNIEELRLLIRGCASTGPFGDCIIYDYSSANDWSSACLGCELFEGPGVDGCFRPPSLTGDCTWYWSSSSVDNISDSDWAVNFSDGSVGWSHENDILSIRCVR